ncbi:hypothetical protein HU200_057485 [Digitaria exilis]|uniref:BHLH domain-containing protein n=1 Tax=Digitaria exilis TaxID=1010633 RepID=A0A835E1F5_9POAL|nr:hypothetical protein HU200_057485 [Digitaria exilis]
MAEELPLVLSVAAKTKGSPARTTKVALALPEQWQTVAEIKRARRRHMSQLYAELGVLLPHLPPRAERARILDEAIAYVAVLRGMVAALKSHDAFAVAGRRAVADCASASGEVFAVGKASCFAARMPAARRPGALTRMLQLFRRHGVQVQAAMVTSVDDQKWHECRSGSTVGLPPVTSGLTSCTGVQLV